ncbi:sensor histidine kinase [Haloferula sp. A504]|uniref:sensor histidine kinase n=1 Tax=Haloferula sp. A504 TaxID=3373601 RepID=UPI0031C6D768|nr:histidine kinase [Verrucomicrobiaceae bacterium E54]
MSRTATTTGSSFFAALLRTMGIVVLAGAATGETPSTTIEAFADETRLVPQDEIALAPLNASSLQFQVVPASLRVRYRLEGADKVWQERSGTMMFVVRFIDKEGNRILHHDFPAKHATPGWSGSEAPFAFVSRKETLRVPESAEYLSVAVSSSGPLSAVGVIAIRGITIRSLPTTDRPERWLMREALGPDSRPIRWNKAGSRPTMGSIIHPDGQRDSPPTLVIVDDDLEAHADIASGHYELPALRPGEQIEVEWQEAYSVGLGGPFELDYERLPAADYRFLVEELSIDGIPTGRTSVLVVDVPGVFWKKWWFWLGCLAGVGSLVGLWARALVRRRIRRQLRHAQLLSDERLRIARDLHDDLGTRLSHISLVGANAEAVTADPESQAAFRQIRELTGELVGALSESVWMLNPRNSDLESLINYLCRLVSELCRLAGIRCRIDDAGLEHNHPISHEFRHNFSLAVKETVNNALRHAEASEILIRIRIDRGSFSVSISDDGVGIREDAESPPGDPGGSGLESVRQRMQSIGGRCGISNLDPRGLRVVLTAPVLMRER